MQIDFGDLFTEEAAQTAEEQPTTGIGRLQKESIEKAKAADRTAEVYKTYLENVKRTGQLIHATNKGLLAGEDIYSLFLKAMDALGMCVSDRGLYERTKATLLAVYGYGLEDPQPLSIELEEVICRLEKLKAAARTQTDEVYSRQLERAIAAHESKAAELAQQIST